MDRGRRKGRREMWGGRDDGGRATRWERSQVSAHVNGFQSVQRECVSRLLPSFDGEREVAASRARRGGTGAGPGSRHQHCCSHHCSVPLRSMLARTDASCVCLLRKPSFLVDAEVLETAVPVQPSRLTQHQQILINDSKLMTHLRCMFPCMFLPAVKAKYALRRGTSPGIHLLKLTQVQHQQAVV